MNRLEKWLWDTRLSVVHKEVADLERRGRETTRTSIVERLRDSRVYQAEEFRQVMTEIQASLQRILT